MRELNECRAEIFWRSQERIRCRRQARKRILACCIPLVLCVAALIWPGKAFEADDNRPKYDGIGTIESSTVTDGVRVYGFGVQKQITDPERTEQIQKRICALLTKIEPPGPSDGPVYGGTVDGLPLDGYTIIIQSNGERLEYTLTGNTLSCTQTDQSVRLTEAQLKSLKVLLGVTEQ